MIIRGLRFNSNLCLKILATMVFATGCQSSKPRQTKEPASLRVHLQATDSRMDYAMAPVYRAAPVSIPIEKNPFLTEVNIADAQVTESQGVLALVIKLDQKGAWILENYTGANPGRNFAIFSQWGKKAENSRWLAAPAISFRITDGVLSFTPDASKAECEEIVRGWRNVAIDEGNLAKPSKSEKKKAEQK